MAFPGNPLRQRLIAAGAQPERADAFVQRTMFDKGAPMTNVAGMKPKGPNEWYNESYASASESLYPQGFRPPMPDSTDFKGYFDVVYGKGSFDSFTKKAETQAFAKYAPTYQAALRSTSPLDKAIIPYIAKGIAPAQIVDGLLKNPQFLAGRTPAEAQSYVTKLFNEYNDAKAQLVDIYGKEIGKNRDYKYGLPDPKLRYGTTTNLSAGTVDILSQPAAAKAYAAYSTKQKDPAKLAQYKAFLVTEANKRQITPWKDEARRRDALKGTKFGG